MQTVKYYEIVLKQYHSETVARIRYSFDGELIESNIYSIPEINNILTLWRMDELLGSFGMHKLDANAEFRLVAE